MQCSIRFCCAVTVTRLVVTLARGAAVQRLSMFNASSITCTTQIVHLQHPSCAGCMPIINRPRRLLGCAHVSDDLPTLFNGA